MAHDNLQRSISLGSDFSVTEIEKKKITADSGLTGDIFETNDASDKCGNDDTGNTDNTGFICDSAIKDLRSC